MKFKDRNLREIAKMVAGNVQYFPYRSSSYITQFFEECDLDFVHDGSTRWRWTAERLWELLQEPQPTAYALPERFMHVLRVLMHKSDAEEDDPDRSLALEVLNKPLSREGYEAFYGEDDLLYPLFRQLGYHRITAAGHQDKALEYGKDVWMKFVLPTQHVLYFGLQAKKDKLDSSSVTKSGNANVAEIHNQVMMMLGHEIFDPEIGKRVLVGSCLYCYWWRNH